MIDACASRLPNATACSSSLLPSWLESGAARGLQLNLPEATALISDSVIESARDGARLTEAIDTARSVLSPDDVLPGVADLLPEVWVEAVFDDGSRLVVVPDPIGGGSLGDNAPGAVLTDDSEVATANELAVQVTVTNTADVPISVTSHFHFFEVNPRLEFDRAAAYGQHLGIDAGSAVRFEPGTSTTRVARPHRRRASRHRIRRTRRRPPRCIRREGTSAGQGSSYRVSRGRCGRMRRDEYAAVHGPTTGDRVHLGDTGLVVEVESDSQQVGDEFLMGFGKTARDGIHLQARTVRETCDLVISNVLLMDAVTGIRKVSIGIREGRISAIGRAGNPDTLDGVDVVVGTGTLVMNGEGLIATAGVIDTHVHGMSPRIMEAALSSGVTTILSQEFGPMWGVGVNSPWGLRTAYDAFDAWPVNIGFLGRGSASSPDGLVEALVEGGVCGFKVHEDTGAHARALDTALNVAEEYDVQVALHTDGLNESLSVADTLSVLDGRTIHAFHVEGCGGGHVPNVLSLAGVANVIGSSTNPTLPYGRDAVAEHLDMIVASHGLKRDLPSDLAMAHDRIRGATMAAEDVLHDLGAIPITSSDAQGMGRAGETVKRTFAMAAKNKADRGPMDGDTERQRQRKSAALLSQTDDQSSHCPRLRA